MKPLALPLILWRVEYKIRRTLIYYLSYKLIWNQSVDMVFKFTFILKVDMLWLYKYAKIDNI